MAKYQFSTVCCKECMAIYPANYNACSMCGKQRNLANEDRVAITHDFNMKREKVPAAATMWKQFQDKDKPDNAQS